MKEATFFEKYREIQISADPVEIVQDTNGNCFFKVDFEFFVHLRVLKEMTKGHKFAGVQLRDYKQFYGFKGKTIRKCYEEMLEIKTDLLNKNKEYESYGL